MPRTGEIVRYENNKPLVESAASGTFFDWLKKQMRSAMTQPSAAVAVEEKPLHTDK
jgi:hypothetical protein